MPLLCLLAAPCASAASDSTGKVDAAAFGAPWSLTSDETQPVYAPQLTDEKSDTFIDVSTGRMLQIEWRQPRDVNTVVIRGTDLPGPEDITIQYWYRIWPDNGKGGWQRVDDPFNGKWVTVKAGVSAKKDRITYMFDPLEKEENPSIEHTGYDFRRTYKIRVIFKTPARVNGIEAYTGSQWKKAEIKLEWNPKAKAPKEWKGKVEAINGNVLSVTPVDGKPNQSVISVEYSDARERLNPDRGIVVFRNSGWKSFSVFVDDVIREGGIYVRDIDAFVSDASRNLSYTNWTGPADKWDGTIMEKVAKMPEQSLEQVMKAMPAKAPREAHLGVPNMRQEFTINPEGNIMCFKRSLRGPGIDLDRRAWDTYILHYAVSTLEKPKFSDNGGRKVKRWLEEGYLPVIHTEWTTGDIAYSQAAFATMLIEKIGDNEDSRKGHEPLVLLDKVEITNNGNTAQKAYFWFELSVKRPMKIAEDGTMILDAPSDGKARPGLTPTRGRFDVNGKGELVIVPDCVPAEAASPDPDIDKSDRPREAIRYTVDLAPGEKHTIYLNVPYVENLDDNELTALRSAKFEDRHAEVVDYWKKRIDSGMKYEVPEPVLNDLFKANLWHVLITTDKDPVTGLYEHGAATMDYYIYANETGMVADSLAMRSEYKEAYRLIEPFLVCQSKKPLPGNFKSKDGLMYAAHPDPENDCYTAQGYNMHHGWALWNLGEYYKWTRDTEWLKTAAPSLIAACDWITRERKATMVKNPDGTKPVEWGLAPAGDLEDVEEYLYWYATNAYYYAGMKTTADILSEIKHPEAARIAKDAESYRKDITDSMRESVATSPVVRLKDGTYVPYVPPRTDVITDRKEGWIREGLYPALHLIDGMVVEPDHQIMTWMLQELEDNIFLSSESGYGVKDQAENFFNFGGFNLQPNLLPNSIAHLRRDEVPQFIRVFYNTFWSSFHPDDVCFCEWVPYYGKSGGPMYKTPDESKFVQYMRYMLILEEGNDLKLGMGVPRAWMTDGKRINVEKAGTFFGEMDLNITSHVSEGFITASINLPSRNPVKNAVLRLRHPEGKRMKKVTVNGKEWNGFNVAKELITLPETGKVEVMAYY